MTLCKHGFFSSFFAVLSSVSLILRCSTLNLIIMCHFRKLKTPSGAVTYETIIFYSFFVPCLASRNYPRMTAVMDMKSLQKTGFGGLINVFLINLIFAMTATFMSSCETLLSTYTFTIILIKLKPS